MLSVTAGRPTIATGLYVPQPLCCSRLLSCRCLQQITFVHPVTASFLFDRLVQLTGWLLQHLIRDIGQYLTPGQPQMVLSRPKSRTFRALVDTVYHDEACSLCGTVVQYNVRI